MITPSDSASAPEQYAAVPVQPADIQAPQGDLSGSCDAAMSEAMARQPQAEALLSSAPGFGEFDVTAGFTGDWPANTEPGG